MSYSICLGFGILLFIISILYFYSTISRISSYQKTIAEVIHIEKISEGDSDSYRTTFKYKTKSNVELTYLDESSSSDWLIGDTTNMAYSQNDPYRVILLTYFGAFKFEIILLAISLPLISIGGGYFIVQKYLI